MFVYLWATYINISRARPYGNLFAGARTFKIQHGIASTLENRTMLGPLNL